MSVLTRYNRYSIERALALHQSEGRIGPWHRDAGRAGYFVVLDNGAPITTRTLRETACLVFGLASGSQAEERKARRAVS